jgi:glucose-1-phosphate adenylyltransferase
MEKVLAIVMAGGAGERLQPLTRSRSKASVPFAGKYRLIDLTLSNCVNSGIRRIFVLTQYLSESLNFHIQDGWSLSGSGLGDFIYTVPAQQKLGAVWYRGTADAVRQNLNLMLNREIEDVVILSGDHVYKMDYLKYLYYHRSRGAGLTVSAVRVPVTDAARRLGVLEVDPDYRLIGFEEKPENPKPLPDNPDYAFGSMGIYMFKLKSLIDILNRSEGMDFGNEIIPEMIKSDNSVYAYDFEKENAIEDFEIRVKNGIREKVLISRTKDSAYWKDVGTIDSFFDASMDLVSVDPSFSLYGTRWPLRTFQRQIPPTKCILGGRISDSIVSEGCIISGGSVEQSILSPNIIVERDAQLYQSVVFEDALIEPGARVRRAIIDKECRIMSGASIGYDAAADQARGCSVSPRGITVVPKGMIIGRYEPALL